LGENKGPDPLQPLEKALGQHLGGDRAAAVATAREGLRRCPDDLHLRYRLAIWLAEAGQAAEAARQFQEILYWIPGCADARSRLAALAAAGAGTATGPRGDPSRVAPTPGAPVADPGEAALRRLDEATARVRRCLEAILAAPGQPARRCELARAYSARARLWKYDRALSAERMSELAGRDAAEAILEYREALRLDPDCAEALACIGANEIADNQESPVGEDDPDVRAAVRAGQLDGAEMIRRALARLPEDPAALCLIAGAGGDSANLYQRALAADPSLAAAWLGLARCHRYESGREEAVFQALRQAAALDPADDDTLAWLAEEEEKRGEWQAAAGHWLAALDGAIYSREDRRRNLTDLLVELGAVEGALRIWRRGRWFEPPDAETFRLIGLERLQSGDLKGAKRFLREAIDRSDDRSHEPWAELGEVLRRLGDQAGAWVAAGNSENGEKPRRHFQRFSLQVRLKLDRGDLGKAREGARILCSMYPQQAEAYRIQAEVLERSGEHTAAGESVRQAESLATARPAYQGAHLADLCLGEPGPGPEPPTADFLVRQAERPERSSRERQEGLRTALALDPGHLGARLALIRLHQTFCFDPMSALLLAREGVSLHPESPRLHFLLGQEHARLQRLPEAVAGYRQAAALDPGLAEAWYRLGELYLRAAGDKRGLLPGLAPEEAAGLAAEALRRAVALDPDPECPWIRLGEAEERLGRLAEAVAAFRQAYEREPYQGDPDPLRRLLAQCQTATEAEKELLAALEPADGALRDLAMARLAKRRQDWPAAARLLGRAFRHLYEKKPEVQAELWEALATAGRWAELLEACQRQALAGLELAPLGHYWRGLAYRQLGDPAGASLELRLALLAGPADPDLRRRIETALAES